MPIWLALLKKCHLSCQVFFPLLSCVWTYTWSCSTIPSHLPLLVLVAPMFSFCPCDCWTPHHHAGINELFISPTSWPVGQKLCTINTHNVFDSSINSNQLFHSWGLYLDPTETGSPSKSRQTSECKCPHSWSNYIYKIYNMSLRFKIKEIIHLIIDLKFGFAIIQ